MKRIKNLPESSFLKLFFAFVSLCLLVGAVCMPDRAGMVAGLWEIIKSPCRTATNCFSIGGYSGTFLNMGLVAAVCALLFWITGASANSVSTLAVLLTTGFGAWGLHVVNMLPPILGAGVFALLKKQKLADAVHAMLFSTGVTPLVSDMLVRYPHAEVVGFHISGVLLGLFVGLVTGLITFAGLSHSPNVHKGMNLYSAALPVGIAAFFLNGLLYKAMGVPLPETPGDPAVASGAVFNGFCLPLFGLCIVLALLLGCTPRDYWRFLRNPDRVTDVAASYGNAVFFMNAGVYGLCIVAYYNIIGATLNGVILGMVFCTVCCCNSGSRPSNFWPIIAGYVAASFLGKWVSGIFGGDFSLVIYAPAIAIGLGFANGLTPICDQYGWQYGVLAAGIHYCLVTIVPNLHGSFCLYNGGFTAIFVCILLVPVLEKFCKTKEQRRLLKTAG